MAIAHPSKLAGFRIAGHDLGLAAPETWQGGTKVALSVWYYNDGIQTVIQRGRRSPKPVRMDFKLTGPDALNNAFFLDALSQKDDPVPVVWADISFNAVLQDCEYTATQDGVQVTLEFVPVTNPNPNPIAVLPPADFSPEDILGDITAGLEGLASQLEQVSKFFDNSLQTLRDGIDQMETAVASAEAQLATVKRLADMPAQAAAELQAAMTTAADTMTQGVADLVQTANANTNLPGEILGAVTDMADTGHQSAERMQYVAMLLTPPITKTVAIEGQTLTDVANQYGVTVAQLVDANPSYAREAPSPGDTIEVPNAGN